MNADSLAAQLPQPHIDYLARDFESFRQLMLDQMSVLTPTWTEESAADLGHVLIDLLAYTADYLSYYQDAAATEAYLGTARLRRSVRRHARLLDYFLHEGCNARVWVHIVANAAARIPVGSLLLTNTAGGVLPLVEARDYAAAVRKGAMVFETLHNLDLVVAHNEMNFYVQDPRTDYLLAAGATSARLEYSGSLTRAGGRQPSLQPGDVLIFEEILDPATGDETKANPRHRHAVRLTKAFALDNEDVKSAGDAMKGTTIIQIEWAEADALPFALYIGRRGRKAVTVARGNIVLADHGRRIAHEDLPTVAANVRYHPNLRQEDLTYRVLYHHYSALAMPAQAAGTQDPRRATPEIALYQADPGATKQATAANPQAAIVRRWNLQEDLLNSETSAPDYVVEMEDGGRAFLRFGFGNLGQPPAPGTLFFARYRVGSGTAGNIGPDTINHIVVQPANGGMAPAFAGAAVAGVRNPLPARGGTDPETLDAARLYAPEAFRHQERCVTTADYAERAGHYAGVAQARAVIRQVGAWRTIFLFVRRRDFWALTPAFCQRLRAYLEPYRYIGMEIEIADPYLVPLRVAVCVHLKAEVLPTVIREKLEQVFSDGMLPDGSPAFFAPANFDFGKSVYQSNLIAAAMAVPGVAWVEATEFCRADAPGRVLEEISIGALEIAELRTSASDPAFGVITFDTQENP